ncbi:MAG: translation elongation factor Ts [Armatimonadetes bacterium]|nr:translation elongation factor Ts [Armatimonadota bacterium]
MEISASDVMKLRKETDAPMMDCKKALVEAGGDFDKAKAILRESGAAQAAKRADRTTSEGIAKFVVSEDGKTAAGVIVECETDFVSGNSDFKQLVNDIVNGFLAAGEASNDVEVNGTTVGQMISDAVGKIRENIQISKMEIIKSADGSLAAYNHHDGKKASLVEYKGGSADAATQVAIQVVAFSPEFLKKEDVPADVIAQEMETEVNRAMKEGKPKEVAENIARGRVNKQYFQERVLLEQMFYADGKVSVNQYLKDNVGGEISGYTHYVVGQSGKSE